MINVQDLYNDCFSDINPIQNGFFIDNFNSYINQASRALLSEMLGLPQQYQYGVPEARTGGINKSLRITDAVSPFAKRVVLNCDTNGLVIQPTDYISFASMRVRYDEGDLYKCMCNSNNPLACPELPNDPSALSIDQQIALAQITVYPEYEVELVNYNEVSSRLYSSIYFPDKTYPICYQYTVQGVTLSGGHAQFDPSKNVTYFQLLPKNFGSVIFQYYRVPLEVVYATTIDPDTKDLVFDPDNSVNLEWSPLYQNRFVQEVRKLYAGFIDKDNMQQAAQQQLTIGT